MIAPLTALALATPIFGFSLTIDLPALDLTGLAGVPFEIAATTPADDSDVAPASAARADDANGSEGEPSTVELMNKRARYGRMHRILGISTWAAMTATVTLGTLQYANLYGFFDSAANTRCLRGNAFFGQDACVGTPTPHLVTALTTAGLYYATFGLSYAMPDPIGLDRGDSAAARRLRTHKRLRWAHFTGMALQMVMGVFVANAHWFGLDRANDYRAMQGLATVHLLTGYATYATLTWAGALMVGN